MTMRSSTSPRGTGIDVLTADRADDLAARFVGGLRQRGIADGERIAFQAPNSAQLLAAVLGCLRGGYVPVVISDKLTDRERGELTADVSPALFVNAADLEESFEAPAWPIDTLWKCRPMHFTSGTSGQPKGVWSGWLDPSQAQALLQEEQQAWAFSPDDRHLVVAPLSHSAPLRFPLMTLMAGGTVVIPPTFDPVLIAQLIDSGEVNTAFMAPAHLQRLLDTCTPSAPQMRLVAHAGSSCPDHVRRAARAAFGDSALKEFYGSTEGQFTTCTPTEFDLRPGTVGRARPGRTLRIDHDGRIWCQVPAHARFEYWGDPRKTEEAWDGDWFTVGDLGYIDDDGYLFLNGRRSDLIITGGVNVYPAEIERIVLDHPQVSQAVAFGLDDQRWGQRVCLAVVGTVSEDDLAAHCAALLAPYKRPKSIHVVPDLPHTHSGKIDRMKVAEYLGLS